MATGLLVILVGPFTRLEPFLSCADKTYEARIVFGTATDTDDAEGSVIEELPVPVDAMDPGFASRKIASLVGPSMQMPPRYSAIKVGGRTAHRVARQGGDIELTPRHVTVHEATLLEIHPESSSWLVRFRVSKGTYVRALARDLGRAVGSAAHLAALRRVSSGPLLVGDALTLESLEQTGVESAFIDPLQAMEMAQVVASPDEVFAGRPIDAPADLVSAEGANHAVVDMSGSLLAIYERSGTRLRPVAVFPRDPSSSEAV